MCIHNGMCNSVMTCMIITLFKMTVMTEPTMKYAGNDYIKKNCDKIILADSC